MFIAKVTQSTARGKLAEAGRSAVEYDHYIAIDWSLKTMAIAHMTRRDQRPRIFERPSLLLRCENVIVPSVNARA
jgi:hypothetical protein